MHHGILARSCQAIVHDLTAINQWDATCPQQQHVKCNVVCKAVWCRRGVFGCHTAFVLRRLRRLCERFYRAHPTFVVTSATVANPKEHVQELLGKFGRPCPNFVHTSQSEARQNRTVTDHVAVCLGSQLEGWQTHQLGSGFGGRVLRGMVGEGRTWARSYAAKDVLPDLRCCLCSSPGPSPIAPLQRLF